MAFRMPRLSGFSLLAIFAVLLGISLAGFWQVPTWLLGLTGIGGGLWVLFGRR